MPGRYDIPETLIEAPSEGAVPPPSSPASGFSLPADTELKVVPVD